MFVVLALFVAAITTAGYFINTSSQMVSGGGEAVGQSLAYQSISKLDLLMILEEAQLTASREGAEKGWNEGQVELYFKYIADRWIQAYLETRGIYSIEITVEKESGIREKSEETYIDLGKYVLKVSGKGGLTEVRVE